MLLDGLGVQDTVLDKVRMRRVCLSEKDTYLLCCLDIVSFHANKSSTIQDAIPVKFAQREYKDDIFLIDNTPEVAQQGLQVSVHTQRRFA